MTIAISVEDVSKEYRLGTINHGTLAHDLQSWWAKLQGKEDPNAPLHSNALATEHTPFLALDDVSFEVQHGDVLGIIGNNGAGKSTLLKILSQVTAPTSGRVRLNGRIASLLEVGTGFHPELTGRENVFLNGAILGMRHAEIVKKFDEIVAFAEIEKFIDTPVKRYSSGMYVRLAFAVAAHLEPEILIVDEVLAVGDVQFQKKCLGKMEHVAKDGKTVLLVSHNIQTILSLSDKVLLLEAGRILEYGAPDKVVQAYLERTKSSTFGQTDLTTTVHYGSGHAKFRSIQISQTDQFGKLLLTPITGCDLLFSLTLEAYQDLQNLTVALTIYDDVGNRLIDVNTLIKGTAVNLIQGQGTNVMFRLKNVRLRPDVYTAGLWIGILNQSDVDGVRYATSFRIDAKHEDIRYTSPFPGVYACEFALEVI